MIPAFGWQPSPEDARDYPMADVLFAATAIRPRFRVWYTDIVLNQGNYPHCVGFSWAGWSRCKPVATKMGNDDGHRLWRAAVRIDGRDPDSWNGGATCRSGLKAMQREGRVAQYFRSQDVTEIYDYVLRCGPVVVGSLWYPHMTYPEGEFMSAGGGQPAGHAYLIRGAYKGYALIRNSWGTEWCKKGDGKMPWGLLQDLLDNNGEAWAATERQLV